MLDHATELWHSGPMSCVLYLDYDGVLHNDSVYRVRGQGIVIRDGVLFEWAHYLVEALRPYPDIRIVLSTSWVRDVSDRHKPATRGSAYTGHLSL